MKKQESRCVWMVWGNNTLRECKRKRIKGGMLCMQHAKMYKEQNPDGKPDPRFNEPF